MGQKISPTESFTGRGKNKGVRVREGLGAFIVIWLIDSVVGAERVRLGGAVTELERYRVWSVSVIVRSSLDSTHLFRLCMDYGGLLSSPKH